jgi:DNA adenine methylase
MKSIIKYPGSKRRVAAFICDKMRPYMNMDSIFIEPFLGGASIALEMQAPQMILGDFSQPLINLYISIRETPAVIYEELQLLLQLPLTQESFLAVRSSWDPRELSPAAAAKFIYLNKTCFNGLVRFNGKGFFNAPWGKRVTMPKFPSLDELMEFSKFFKSARLINGDFETTMNMTSASLARSIIYLDPPYLDTYDGYTGKGFDLAAHERLAAVSKKCWEAGAKVFLSNIDNPKVRELYAWATSIEQVPVFHAIGAKSERRSVKQEVLVQAV